MRLDASLPASLKASVTRYNAAHPGRIASVEDERRYPGNAPFWLYTLPGWQTDPECHTFAAEDEKDLSDALTRIAPCFCSDCRAD